MKTCHIWVRDEVWMTVNGLEPSEMSFFWNKFGIEVPGARFTPMCRLGRWDGKLRFFDKHGKVYLRLLEEIVPFLEKWNYNIELHDERRPLKLIEGRLTPTWFSDHGRALVHLELRPYQVAAVNKALDEGSGSCVMSTGSGKTMCIAGLVDVMGLEGLRSITIVPSSDLVNQTSNTFRLCGIEHGLYSGAVKNIYAPHVIATWQALNNNPTVMETFNSVVVDEMHGASAATISDLITNHGKHIGYRFGFTGTWPKAETDQYSLRGSLGNILYTINAADLISMGYLAKIEIEPIEIQETATEEFPDYASEKAFTARSPERLEFMADLIIARAAQHGNTLVLVNTIKQGQQLQKLIKNSVFLHGATENEVRAEWYALFAERDDLIVIATSGIASTGISIDRIFLLVLLDAGKSFIKAIQSIGRGLRKSADKEFVHVMDVYSGLKWGKKHARERKKYYLEASYPVLKTSKAKL